MKFRIWWHNNYTMGIRDAFRLDVPCLAHAQMVLNVLMKYDLHLCDVITDNASGLEVEEDGEWREWLSEEGQDIWDWIEANKKGDDV